MAEAAAAGDEILTEDDASRVFEELISAQNQSYRLGLKLGLRVHEVDAIFSQYQQPSDRLLHVIIAFLRRARLTWKMIIEALRSVTVDMPALASEIEATYYPDQQCQVSGPGLTSATINHPTHVLVELPTCKLQLNVTAQLELVPNAIPTNQPEATPTNQPTTTSLPVVLKSPSQYEVSYTAVSRGQHKLHVQVNDREINGSPFRVTVYPDPRQLGYPVRKVTGLDRPWGIAFNNHEQMIVSEQGDSEGWWDDEMWFGIKVSILDIRGKVIRTFGSFGDRPNRMINPCGVATDDADNIYVSNDKKLQKFTSNGELIRCIGQEGNKERKFNYPYGITVYNNQLYVCDTWNHCIQVFDLDLYFVRSIGSHGKGRGEFDRPHDVKFDTAGNMYVTDYNNNRVQILDSSGRFIRSFGQEEGNGKLKLPTGLHIADKYVYVSDVYSNCIVVYETSGQFVTLFGRYGSNNGDFNSPFCITSDIDGFIYVCDFYNKRVQIF